MIKLYTGTPGSGKSLHMAKDIYEKCNCRKNRLVIANFQIKHSKFKHGERIVFIDNSELETPARVVQVAMDWYTSNNIEIKEDSILLLIDECQLLFNSRDWAKKGRSEWLSFFTQHRKLGFNVILTCQFDMMIDKQIRSLIEYETVHRKCTNYGIAGGLIQLFALGQPLFIAVEKWYTINERTGFYFFFAHKRYYDIYDTYNTFKSLSDNENNVLTNTL